MGYDPIDARNVAAMNKENLYKMNNRKLRSVGAFAMCIGLVLGCVLCRSIGSNHKWSSTSIGCGDLVAVKCGEGIVVAKDGILIDEDCYIVGTRKRFAFNPNTVGLYIYFKDQDRIIKVPVESSDNVDVYDISCSEKRKESVLSQKNQTMDGRRVMIIGDDAVMEVELVNGKWEVL